jgi:two-component system alkaline phosphatase synthesis response regulator PhoP
MDSTRGVGSRILLVDDQPDQVEMYQFALEHGGFIVHEAANGTDAIARARLLRPDLIVLDLRLPDMSGWDVCAVLKGDQATAQIPIVILTAAASATLAEQAAQHGCAAHLVKPCFPEDLTKVVRQILAAA